MPVILATQQTEIRRIEIGSQPRQTVLKILSRKNPSQKRAGGVAQGVGSEFKSQYHKQTNKQKTNENCSLSPTLHLGTLLTAFSTNDPVNL
jgi:hypothetical protein